MKTNTLKTLTGTVLVSMLALSTSAQQLKTPAPSPLQTLDQSFALSNIKIEYSRPSVKGRVVFGDLVPYGKIWRTGANASTKITFGDDVTIEGKAVVAGTYALYTIPEKTSWDIIFYKDLTLGGSVADFKPENEVLRVKGKVSSIQDKVESFTIDVTDITSTSANIELVWEKTRVTFSVKTEVDAKIMKNIEDNVIKDSRPYFQAANYYYENDKDLNKALTWVNTAIEQSPKYFTVHLKAKIQMKMKDYAGAIVTAEKSLALAKEGKSDDYVRLNEKLIAEAKKAK